MNQSKNQNPEKPKKSANSKLRLRLEKSFISMKKLKKSSETRSFYRFIFENNLQKEGYEILSQILALRKKKKNQKNKSI